MSIDWFKLKMKAAKMPPAGQRRLMEQAAQRCRGHGPLDTRTPAELAEYVGVSVEMIEVALASDHDRTRNQQEE